MIDTERLFVANRNVSLANFEFTKFHTEKNFDFIRLQRTGSNVVLLASGQKTAGFSMGTSAPANFSQTPLRIRFTSDYSVRRPGFRIGVARVCCSTGTTSIADVPWLTNVTGLLLGTNDVVYLRVPAKSNGVHVNVAVSGSGADVDVYARCNALPTPSAFHARGFSANAQEFLRLSDGDCYQGTWYLAVHSFSGIGQFSLVVSPSMTAHRRILRVGIEASPGTSLASIDQMLRQAVRQVYGMTEGQILLDDVRIWRGRFGDATAPELGCGPHLVPEWNRCGGELCDVCFRQDNADRATATMCGGRSQIPKNMWPGDPELIAHELGHSLLCLPDEYAKGYALPDGGSVPDRSQCGHTMMARHWGRNENICIGGSGSHENHRWDPDPNAPVYLNASGWEYLHVNSLYQMPSLYTRPMKTPHNYDYLNHDFNGQITTTIMH
jgi:hypothetical protein